MALRFDTERVEREDLVTFVNAAFSASRQAEFYRDARGQAVAIDFLHQYILGNYRRLYARCLAAGINHDNQATIVLNLLATSPPRAAAERTEEGALVSAALAQLPPPRAWRVLRALGERRVNNRRARAIARQYAAERPDLAFDAIKYRPLLRAVARHAHLPLPEEVGPFLFEGGWRRRVWRTPLLESFRQAHYAADAIYDLPFTVAEGLAHKHGVPREVFLQRIEPRLTALERLRLQGAAAEAEVRIEVDLGRAPLTRLCLYALSLDEAEREARRAELEAALDAAAARALGRAPMRLGRVAAVLDRSYSASGSTERRRRPLAVALGASRLLRAAASEYRALWTPPLGPPGASELTVRARGQTDLAGPLLEALEWGADLVVLVSDGFENDPPGAVAELVRQYRRLPGGARASIVHLNPVFDAERYAPRALGGPVPTVGLRDAEDLLTMLGFARFAEGRAPLAELEEYLARRTGRLLAWHTRRRARAAGPAAPEPEETP